MVNYKELCRRLIISESSEDVVIALKSIGFWENDSAWKMYGDIDNNWSIINNQQSRSEAALIENLVNAADANLIAQCKIEGTAPDDRINAPTSIAAALERYYGIGKDKFANMAPLQRTKLAEETCGIVATGEKKNPCYGIFDFGEGQSPRDFPNTFLSLAKSNKLSIPFVQGKFNQGSTGVLPFCGPEALKLIVSRKHPELAASGDNTWGFTLIRRVKPTPENSRRASIAEYLAPNGQIATFESNGIEVIPGDYPDAYNKKLPWGTYVKLYNYNIGKSLRTNILFDLNYRMSSLLVSPMLPIRVYERRPNFRGNSFETTLLGIELRLSEDRSKNVEFDEPISGQISTDLGEFGYSIYVLTRDADKGNYTGQDGVLFAVNGQSHGALPRTFFKTKSVGMSYLSDSLIVIVDCSKLSPASIEEMFASSRDRLKESDKMEHLKSVLADILSRNSVLKNLRARRRKEEIEAQVKDDQIAEKIFQRVIKASPALNKVLIQGLRLSDPFGPSDNSGEQTFSGQLHPSYFRLQKKTSEESPRLCQLGRTARVTFETDVQNDYLSRANYPGSILVVDNQDNGFEWSHWFNPFDRIWTMNIEVPENGEINSDLELHIVVTDETLIQPITETLHIKLVRKTESNSNSNGTRQTGKNKGKNNDNDNKPGLKLPPIIEVRKEHWESQTPVFNKFTGMEIIDNGENSYDFKINMDNLYLQTEIKNNPKLGKLVLENRFKYGLLFLSMAILNDELSDPELKDAEEDKVKLVRNLTSAAATVILSIIEGLSTLDDSDMAA